MMNSIRMVWGAIPLVALAGMAGAQVRTIRVDASREAGEIRSFQGVNGGPLEFRPKPADVTRLYRAVGIDMIRAHDYGGPVDIDAKWSSQDPLATIGHPDPRACIFPDWEKDSSQEASYNWAPTDRVIGAMVNAGAKVFYQIGRTWGADPEPPADFDKYADIVKHVAMHYNGGWANGFHYNIRYWEVWNEPDLVLPRQGKLVKWYWGGTPEQYYSLYEKIARAIKSYDPGLKVGGPAQAAGGMSGPYREGLIAWCAAHRAPLDFYSWHRYSTASWDPYDLARIGRDVQHVLAANGFGRAENVVDEWNMDLDLSFKGPVNQTSAEQAAFTASALIYLEDSPVTLSMHYRGDGEWMGLFNADGRFRKKAYVFQALRMMLDTPRRLAAVGGDTYGFAALAGRSADGNTVQVLISNFQIPEAKYNAQSKSEAYFPARKEIVYQNNGGYDLKVTGLAWGKGPFTVKRYRISRSEDWSQTESSGEGAVVEVKESLPPPGVELIVILRK
jgi:xylan 1,4-beta-xylosidase